MVEKYEVGDKFVCITGLHNPKANDDHNRGGSGWRLGEEFIIDRIITNVDAGVDILWPKGEHSGIYADWTEPFEKPKLKPPTKTVFNWKWKKVTA